MYIFRNQAIEPLERLHDFVDEFNFGILFTESLEATHLPFFIKRNEGELGTLYAHISKANPQSQALDGKPTLTTFSGPHAYISPSWIETRPVVPTWNYAVVQAKGTATLLDTGGTLAAIEGLLRKQEPALLEKRELVTDDVVGSLIDYIVGIRIEVTDIQGSLKLGQTDPVADQRDVVQGLSAEGRADGNQLLDYMQQLDVGMGR